MTMDRRWDKVFDSVKIITLKPFIKAMREQEASRLHFKGWSERGPVNKKTDLSSVDEFEWIFGGISRQPELHFALAQGNLVSFTREVSSTATKAKFVNYLIAGRTYLIEAADEGEWGNNLEVEIQKKESSQYADIIVNYPPQPLVTEHFREVCFTDGDARNFPEYVNARSRLIQVRETLEPGWVAPVRRPKFNLAGGRD